MARRRAERPAERGMRRAETNAVAAYLTALKGGGPRPGLSVRRTHCPKVRGACAFSTAVVKPVARRFGSSQGSLPSRSLLEEVEGVVVMWRRKRWAEDQKTIDALSRANARLTADLETMVSESERLKEEVRQRDEVIAALRGESKTKDED
jgi:hypothetical protein